MFPFRILFLSAFAAILGAQIPRDPGPKAGQTIPAFSLPDQNGKPQNLASLTGPKGLMLVFFRSADW